MIQDRAIEIGGHPADRRPSRRFFPFKDGLDLNSLQWAKSLLGVRGYCRQRTTEALLAEITA